MPARRTTDAAKLQARQLLRHLRSRFPALFPPAHKDNLKPWAVGEAARLRQVLAEDGETVSSHIWNLAIRGWFHGAPRRRIAHLKCLTEGAPRYGRHGNVSGAVSETEAAQAAAELPKHQNQPARRKAAAHTAAGQAKASEPKSSST